MSCLLVVIHFRAFTTTVLESHFFEECFLSCFVACNMLSIARVNTVFCESQNNANQSLNFSRCRYHPVNLFFEVYVHKQTFGLQSANEKENAWKIE